MLAESVEDRIFELVDELDELVKKHGGLEDLPDDIREESGKQSEDTRKYSLISCHFFSHAYISSQLFTISIINSRDGQANTGSADSIR